MFHLKANTEHPTLNTERLISDSANSAFDVRCSMFGVCFDHGAIFPKIVRLTTHRGSSELVPQFLQRC